MSSRYLDPEGERHGVPTWPWRLAPKHFRTFRQLDAQNLRPAGEYEGQVRGRGWRQAYLYDGRNTRPKQERSELQQESLRIARMVRSANACERHGVDASEMRDVILQARMDLAVRKMQRQRPGSERQR